MGHVNNARYFEFFEAGRTTWYEEGGLMAACRDAGHDHADTVVVNVNCDFLRECRLGERLIVKTWPQRMGRKSFAVFQRLMKEDGEISAEAVVTSVVMDLDTRLAIPLPDAVSPLSCIVRAVLPPEIAKRLTPTHRICAPRTKPAGGFTPARASAAGRRSGLPSPCAAHIPVRSAVRQ